MIPLPPDAMGAWLGLSEGLTWAIAQAAPTIVAVDARPRLTSSGTHWRPGVIVTSAHTVRREDNITVILADGRSLPATLVGRDGGTDLAVLTIEEQGLALGTRGDTTALQVGHLVLAIAAAGDGRVTASMGIVSVMGGAWRNWHGGRIDQFIRPDLTLYPGASGGALINLRGEILGINVSAPKGLVLTIPGTTVNRVVDQLLQGGGIARGYLGLEMEPVELPDRLLTDLNLSQHQGLMVVRVEPEAPADQAGVMLGDILLMLGDRPVQTIQDVHSLLDGEQIGQLIRMQLIRGGVLLHLPLTVGERPSHPDP